MSPSQAARTRTRRARRSWRRAGMLGSRSSRCSPGSTIVEALRCLPSSGPGPRVLGAHLECPFISRERPGTHPLEHIREPDVELLDRLLDAGPVTEMTLAPELPGAEAVIDRLRER